MSLESSIKEREEITQRNNETLKALLDEKKIIPIKELIDLLDKSDSDYTRYQGTRYTVRFRSTLQKEFKKIIL